MARHVRGSVGGRRKWVAMSGAIGAFIAALIFFVLPAFGGAVGGLITPRSLTEGLVPIETDLGGVNNDCVAVHSSAAYTVRFENPSSPPPMPITVGGKPVTITSTVSSISGEQFYSFSITGAVARDVVVKGGSNSAHYAYDNPTIPAQAANGSPGAWSPSTTTYPARAKKAVTADSNLHATRASTGSKKLYTVSHVSFCLDTGGVATLSGTVFADANDNGIKDSGATPEVGIPDRTVLLYAGASTPAATATSQADGSYSFPNLSANNVTYKVCLAAAAGNAQTLPRSSTTGAVLCTGTAPVERSYGYGLTPTGDTGGLNFGEALSNCTLETGNPPRYIVKFTYQCKDTARFVVDYSDVDGNKLASVEPLDTTQPKVPVLEKIIWSLPADGHQFQLLYDDTIPYGDTTPTLPGDLAPKPMLDCKVEPRDAGAADPEFTLSSLYDQFSESGAVVRTGETSCLVASTISVEAGTYTAYVYSALDGWRSTP